MHCDILWKSEWGNALRDEMFYAEVFVGLGVP